MKDLGKKNRSRSRLIGRIAAIAGIAAVAVVLRKKALKPLAALGSLMGYTANGDSNDEDSAGAPEGGQARRYARA